MSELLKSKHMLCVLVGLVVVVGVLLYMSWTPNNGSCGCAVGGQQEGYKSIALQSMAEQNMKESLYTPKPKENLITYARPPERFVPAPSMQMQMNSMRGSPVSKSMNSMAPTDPQSPFINYAQ